MPAELSVNLNAIAMLRNRRDLPWPSVTGLGRIALLNIEGYPTDDFLDLVEANAPEQVTLVPDDPSQATSDHGWDFAGQGNFLRAVVQRLKKNGARVSLFCDPDADRASLEAAKATGADRVEFYTGPYGGTFDDPVRAAAELEKLEQSGRIAAELGLGVNAGHDLTVENLPALARVLPNLVEVSIGHGLTADALEYGMAETVRRFIRACG